MPSWLSNFLLLRSPSCASALFSRFSTSHKVATFMKGRSVGPFPDSLTFTFQITFVRLESSCRQQCFCCRKSRHADLHSDWLTITRKCPRHVTPLTQLMQIVKSQLVAPQFIARTNARYSNKNSRSILAIFVRSLRLGYCCCSTTLKWTSVLLLSEDSYSHFTQYDFHASRLWLRLFRRYFRSVLDSSSLSDVRIIWSAHKSETMYGRSSSMIAVVWLSIFN